MKSKLGVFLFVVLCLLNFAQAEKLSVEISSSPKMIHVQYTVNRESEPSYQELKLIRKSEILSVSVDAVLNDGINENAIYGLQIVTKINSGGANKTYSIWGIEQFEEASELALQIANLL